jgi:hypothetical protein
MGIRETVEKNSKVATAFALGLIVVALVAMFKFGGITSTSAAVKNTFYSDDGGASFSIGDGADIVPNQRRAKPAYRASVFTCEGGGGRFVGYLTRFQSQSLDAIAAAEAQVEQLKTKYDVNDPHVQKAIEAAGAARAAAVAQSQVKRPGDKDQWVLADSPEGLEIMTKIPPPAGKSGVVYQVLP